VISAAARGEANLSALAAMFLTTPLVLMSRSEAPVASIEDLRGKRVAIHCDGLHILEGLLRLHGIGANEVKVTEVVNALANLTSGRFDAVQGYAVCEPLEHAALGLRPTTLVMRHKALHPYAQVMFSPSDALAVVPDLYRAALDATFAGWQAAMADPAGAAAAIRAVGAPMTDPALEAVALELVADLVRGTGDDGARGLGRIDPARWAANVAAYATDGLVPKSTSPDCGLRTDFWIDTPDSGRDDADRAARAGAGA
jgi:ABC-type nitrate/sulfonate/bicarbonate transport system substrate-binding protein